MSDSLQTTTPTPKHTSMLLVVTSSEGNVRGIYPANHPGLMAVIQYWSGMDPASAHPPVRKTTEANALSPLGQDMFEVSGEFLTSVSGLLTEMTWSEVQTFVKLLPSTGVFTFVISH